MEKNAILSEDRKYRYILWRIWDQSKPMVLFIALNPSTADETHDDRTVSKCIGFARKWDEEQIGKADLVVGVWGNHGGFGSVPSISMG